MSIADNSLNLEGLLPVVGLRIREARTDRAMSQKDLVGERFSKSYISSIERGKITPSLKALEYIARRLEVSVSYLLTGLTTADALHSNDSSPTSFCEDYLEPEIPVRWELFLYEARVLRKQGRFEQVRNLLQTKVRVRQLGVDQLKQYHFLQSQLNLDLEDPAAAQNELEITRNLAVKTSDVELMARVRQLSAQIYLRLGKPVQAIEQLRQVLPALDQGNVRDPQFRLCVYNQLGSLHRQLGDDREAVQMYQQALEIAEENANPAQQAVFYWTLAVMYREEGHFNEARLYAARSLAMYENLDYLRLLSTLRSGYGVIMLETRQFEEAERQFQLSYRLAAEHNDRPAELVAGIYLCELYLEQNQLVKARQYSDALEDDLDQLTPVLRGQALSCRANVLAAQGEHHQAAQRFEQAVTLLEGSAAKELLSKVYFQFARLLNSQGESARAAEMFERAYYQLGRPGLSPSATL